MSLKNLTVLFADDDKEYSSSFSNTLSHFFNNVLVASDGEEAFEMFEQNKCDIVILDLQMPKLNGLQVTEKIRQTNKSIPIIIVTNYQDFESARSGYKYELVDYIIKPIPFQTLLDTINRCEQLINDNHRNIQITKNVYYDATRKVIINEDKEYKLGYAESIILEAMIHRKGQLVDFMAFNNIMMDNELSSSSLRNIIYNLRKILPKDCIVNISKSGYILK